MPEQSESPRPVLFPEELSPAGVKKTLELFLGYMPQKRKGLGHSDYTGYVRLARTASQFSGIISGGILDLDTGRQVLDTTRSYSIAELKTHLTVNHPVAIDDEILNMLQEELNKPEHRLRVKWNTRQSDRSRHVTIHRTDHPSHISIRFPPESEMIDGLTAKIYPREGNASILPLFKNQPKLIHDLSVSVAPSLESLTRLMDWSNTLIGGVLRLHYAVERPTPFFWEGYEYALDQHESGVAFYNKANFPQEVIGQVIPFDDGVRSIIPNRFH